MKKTKEDEIIDLRSKGMTYKEIQDKLNVSAVTVCKWLSRNGMLKKDKYTPDVASKIKMMASDGVSVKDIAAAVGIEYNRARGYMTRNKIRINKKNKLRDKVLSMSELLTPKEIAKELGVSAGYVRSVRYKNGGGYSGRKQRATRAFNMLNKGMNIDDIAEILAVKPSSVERYIKGGHYE